MAMISKKKEIYSISNMLRAYIQKYDREIELPIDYCDLIRYDNLIPQYDKNGQDTLWETVFYPQGDMDQIYRALKTIYNRKSVV